MSGASLQDLHDNSVKPGVYVAIKVDESDRLKVLSFCERVLGLNMENSSSPYSSVKENMHATLLAAKDPKNHDKDSVEKFITIDEFEARPTHWEIFESSNTGKRCLVLKLDCPEMKNFHEKLKKETGLMHSFNTFALHVSVHYDYKGEIPTELPDFTIKFRGTYTKPYHYKLQSNKEESAMKLKAAEEIQIPKEVSELIVNKDRINDKIREFREGQLKHTQNALLRNRI